MMRYKEIKEQLTQIIGRMDPGTRLPSRPVLCRELETTRTTLDRAIKELKDEGVLSSQYGSGTYVIGLIDGKVPHVENWGVIVPNIMGDTYPPLIQGIENVASAHGANVILCSSENDPDKQDRYIRRLLASGVSGFLIVPAVSDSVVADYQLYGTLLDSDIPFVFCNRSVEGIDAPVVKSNDFYGGYIATKHLISKGYRHIAFLALKDYRTSVDRCQGYISALLERGLEINRRLIILSGTDAEQNAFDIMRELIASAEPLDAVFCFNDVVALDACRAIRVSGKAVSDDIGVIGYDNTVAAATADPPVSSVAYKSMEIGEKAANILYGLTNGKQPNSNFKYYLFQPNIVEHESCLGPRTASLVHKNQIL